MDAFFEIGIVGIVLSFIMEGFKAKFGPKSKTTKWCTVLLSVVLGTVYFLAKDTSWWQAVLGVLATSTTFYQFILKR